MSERATEVKRLTSEWTALLAQVRLLPRELQASVARVVKALLDADGDKSAALARYHKRIAVADGDMATIAALEALAAELGAATKTKNTPDQGYPNPQH